MANVHDLFTGKKDDDDEKDESNNRYVGGVGERGGGSGLAVEPNRDDDDDDGGDGAQRDAVFGLAESAGSVQDGEQIRRTITMYRMGFTVDDGPYRRLDDPENAEFLRALAQGRTPRELSAEGGNVVVGLVDKRTQDYVETFQSFSGAGASLGTASTTETSGAGVFDPAELPEPPAVPEGAATTSIAVRLLNGKRKIVKLALTNTVADLAAHLRGDSDSGASFRLVAGFPPTPLQDASATIESAGLKGAQVSMQKA